MAAADEGGGRDEPVFVIDRKPGAFLQVALDHDRLGPAVAVEIGKARGDVLEDAGGRQGDPAGGAGLHLQDQRAVFHGIAEHAVIVARGRIVVAGADNLGLGGTGCGKECRSKHHATRHQICFSGMKTFSPSSASETFN